MFAQCQVVGWRPAAEYSTHPARLRGSRPLTAARSRLAVVWQQVGTSMVVEPRVLGNGTILVRQLGGEELHDLGRSRRRPDDRHPHAVQAELGLDRVACLEVRSELWIDGGKLAHLLPDPAETGEHPLLHLQTAAAGRELQSAGDMAAVLYWRLPALRPTNPGPLPWLPGIPPTLHAHPVWGAYLARRSQLVADLAGHHPS